MELKELEEKLKTLESRLRNLKKKAENNDKDALWMIPGVRQKITKIKDEIGVLKMEENARQQEVEKAATSKNIDGDLAVNIISAIARNSRR